MIVPNSAQARLLAAKTIRGGGLIAFRTDTFYGLGADPLNKSAIHDIRELKGREEQKPILLVISDPERVDDFFAYRSKQLDEVMRQHWPGPLTLVGPARPELPVELTSGRGTIGLRLPADEDLRAFVRACGGALTATSANPSGSPPPQSAKDVERYFPKGISLIIDSGTSRLTEPSTVLDLSGERPRLLREGVIKQAALADILQL
ncbi:MAG TPA: L-threonylcarbamoyladenylate synthase [Pyrinomonadaceae bacterium]|nr:L-threonylcarbamoyladenylate synthase [Pyrinomonadaceae bacterium]